ncbi:hypothetical protein [Celeribacter marinus]|uniref:hypothetical protein n=1 Tax=Celeribacter marinus TaxID=1397108 RepID=UPI0014706E0D|nr:hypothetical protein [Celeribacter marinus]
MRTTHAATGTSNLTFGDSHVTTSVDGGDCPDLRTIRPLMSGPKGPVFAGQLAQFAILAGAAHWLRRKRKSFT